jgi:hypothetical protein
MSFFAGFVDGVFKGKDWREGRDDRARRRKMDDERFDWEREDRDWTGEARGRQRTVWTQAEQDRARRLEAEDKAKSSQDRIDESRRSVLGGGELSVMDAVPQGEDQPTPSAPSARTSPPAQSSQGLTVRGALGELGTGAQGANVGRDVFTDRLAAAAEEQRRAQAPAPTTAPAPVQQSAAQPDPALVAEGARIAGIQPYVPGQDRQPTPSRGFSILDAIVSPAQAGTMPQEAGKAAAPVASSGSSARRRDPVAPSQAAPAPATPSPEAQARAAATSNRVQGALSAVNPMNLVDRLVPMGASVAGTAANVAGTALSAVGATDMGAQMFDTGQGMKEAGRRLDGRAPSGAAPAPATAPSQQGQAPTTTPRKKTDQTQFFIGDTPISLSGPTPMQTGTVADVVAQVTGSPVTEGSLVAAGESIAKSAGMSAAAALRSPSQPAKPASKAEARAVAREAGVRFSKEQIDSHAKVLEAEGRFDDARAWREYAGSENTRKGMEKLAEAMYYWNMNDEGKALQAIVELYNIKGYYDDGLSALSEGTSFQYDAQGNIVGLTAAFRDDATGKVFQQTIKGPRDKIMALVIGGLSPEATFAAGMEAIGGSLAPKASTAPKMTPELSLKIEQEAREQAKETGGLNGATPEAIAAARERIMQGMGFDVGAVPVFTD